MRTARLVGTIIVLVVMFLASVLFSQKVEYIELEPETEETIIEYDTQNRPNDKMWQGEEKIVQEGKEGKKIETRYYIQKYVNEIPEGPPRELVAKRDVKIQKPIPEIIEYGTKVGCPTKQVWEIKTSWQEEFYYSACKIHTSIEILDIKRETDGLLVKYKINTHYFKSQDSWGEWWDEYFTPQELLLEITNDEYSGSFSNLHDPHVNDEIKSPGVTIVEIKYSYYITWFYGEDSDLLPSTIKAEDIKLTLDLSEYDMKFEQPLSYFWEGTFPESNE